MNTQDKYVEKKKILAKLTAFAVLFVSFSLSANGFGLSGKAVWIGYIIALAVTSAELIFNTRIRELNWTMVVVGVLAYTYSIYTNIAGFFQYANIVFGWNVPTVIAVLSGAFVDVYPEMAMAWAYGASKDGDFVGNLSKVISDGKVINPEIASKLPQRVSGTTHTTIGKYKFPSKVEANLCPHGHEDWDDCPVCGH